MKKPDEQPRSSLTLSMLISESVYKLVVVIERLLRWFDINVMQSLRVIYWCLRW